jgi:hypothetical protein
MAEESNLALKAGNRDAPAAPASKKFVWAGRVVSALPALMLIFSGVLKLAKPTQVVEEFTRLGYSENVILGIGILELACVAVYVFPRTAVLGAILITGYLGGAVATHLRVADPYIPPILVGVFVWGGLYLRDARLRVLLPIRK